MNVGDVVVSTGCVQHDYDMRPFVQKCEVVSCGKKIFGADQELMDICADSCEKFIVENRLSSETMKEFGINNIRMHKGVIASGDQFISDKCVKDEIVRTTPQVLAVEMEGASIAQVCHQSGMQYCVVRIVSDAGDDHAAVDFNKFCDKIAGDACAQILENIVDRM